MYNLFESFVSSSKMILEYKKTDVFVAWLVGLS